MGPWQEAIVGKMRQSLLIPFVLLAFCESNDSPLWYDTSYAQSPPKSPQSMSPKWKREVIDTTASAGYLSEAEKQVVVEVNMVRTDPAEYAQRFLVPLRSYYQGPLVRFPGESGVSTHEGIGALDESIKELVAAKPVSPLFPKKGLTLAARDLARDQGKTGATGHTGSDGSTDETRINRYGKWDISSGECVSYGNGEARRIVTSLLIDDGVPSRGHRRNLLNGTFGFIGVAVGPHRLYGQMCVMDFAGSYQQ